MRSRRALVRTRTPSKNVPALRACTDAWRTPSAATASTPASGNADGATAVPIRATHARRPPWAKKEATASARRPDAPKPAANASTDSTHTGTPNGPASAKPAKAATSMRGRSPPTGTGGSTIDRNGLRATSA